MDVPEISSAGTLGRRSFMGEIVDLPVCERAQL